MFRSLFSLVLGFSSLGLAADRASYYDEAWLKINQYSPVEGFHSHGSYGWHLGIGAIRTEGTQTPDDSSRNGMAPTQVPRLFIIRGTPWRLDFGASLARLEGRGKQYGGHVQYTVFEGFQQPAIALRLSRMETTDVTNIRNLRTDSAMLGISYGLFRFLGFSLGVGKQRQHMAVKTEEDDTVFGLTAGEEAEIKQDETVWSIGLRLHLFTPFASLGIERIYTHPQDALTVAKFSYML